ncbi:chromate transporter [Paenibacillus senegalensis]|uniref:chromate transporter n=1 Tax=Paenibacillus senegalensis TaxID=1465766 RepID=UPI0002887909|nr:chromate transporter [Paenibacillus senegalensis]
MIWLLFWSFFKIGLLSFGGGYAMLPIIESEVARYEWMSGNAYAQTVALVSLAPGPLAANMAVSVGYHTAGIAGSAAAMAGFVTPSILLIVLIVVISQRFANKELDSFYYGIRPVIVAFVFYGAFRMAQSTPLLHSSPADMAITWIIAAAAYLSFSRFHLHPLLVLSGSGVAGWLLFQ